MKDKKPVWEWETKTIKRRLIFSSEHKSIYKLGSIKIHIKTLNGITIKIGKKIPITNFTLFYKGKESSVSNDLYFLFKKMEKL